MLWRARPCSDPPPWRRMEGRGHLSGPTVKIMEIGGTTPTVLTRERGGGGVPPPATPPPDGGRARTRVLADRAGSTCSPSSPLPCLFPMCSSDPQRAPPTPNEPWQPPKSRSDLPRAPLGRTRPIPVRTTDPPQNFAGAAPTPGAAEIMAGCSTECDRWMLDGYDHILWEHLTAPRSNQVRTEVGYEVN